MGRLQFGFIIIGIAILFIIGIMLWLWIPVLWNCLQLQLLVREVEKEKEDEESEDSDLVNIDKKILKKLKKIEDCDLMSKGLETYFYKTEAFEKEGYICSNCYYQYSNEESDGKYDSSKYEDINFYNNTLCCVTKEKFHLCFFTLKDRKLVSDSEIESSDKKEIILDDNPDFTKDFIIQSSSDEEKVKKFFNEKVCKLFRDFHQSGYEYESYMNFLIILCPRRLDEYERNTFVSNSMKLLQDIVEK